MSAFDAKDGSSSGTRVPYTWALLKLPRFGGLSMTITTVGLDIIKSVFQVHGVDADGQVVSAVADQGRSHRAGQQDCQNGMGDARIRRWNYLA
jgi:hypothetical protein